MVGIVQKVLTLYITLLFVSVPFSGLASGDGGVFGKYGSVFQLDQNSQIGVINHANGVQKMIISINFDWSESTSTAWIFPIPADPQQINVDLAGGVPTFSGKDVIEEANEDLTESFLGFGVSYLGSVWLPLPVNIYINNWLVLGLAPSGGGVEVHKHLEKYGMVIEVISATDGAGVYDYLADNDLEITQGLIPQLDDYVEKDYSFVVTWIAGTQVYVREPGVIVEFPTEEPYYPLILTSVYGNSVIPMGIIVKGHVSPRIYDDIKPYTDVKYMRGSPYLPMWDATSEVRDFAREIEAGWDGSFTTINISAPSNAFTQDLWIKKETPSKVGNANVIHNVFGGDRRLSLVFVLTLTLAPLLGFLIGPVLLGWKRENLPMFILMAIANVIGILGLILGAIMLKTRHGISPKKAAAYAVLCSLSFITIILAIYGVSYLLYL